MKDKAKVKPTKEKAPPVEHSCKAEAKKA